MGTPSPERIRGLDAIRCVLACWVTVGHIGLPELPFDRSTPLGWLATGLYRCTINGPAAVIAFFVISGFCIHLPYRESPPRSWGRYYVRRYFRILVPLVAAVTIAKQLGLPFDYFGASILWSIVCEEIYYAIYPVLRRLRAAIGWPSLLAVAFAGSFAVAAVCGDKNYPSSGLRLTWLLGLPCWLMGCVLAEQSNVLWQPTATRTVWSWRFSVWFASCICLVLRFHTPISYPWTLNLFAVMVFFWLRVEIRNYRTKSPWPFLEWAGRWSYSLYLFHVVAISAYVSAKLPTVRLMQFAFSLVASYLFFLVIEQPSHRIARWLGRDRLTTASTPLGT